ncbi:glycosyltransferase [Methanolobus mangrovi]|uniref:Glycosyltransferase n=1 Tax=Methanolobus mangrovi TaxID=3072977 RepID=A0AA51UHI2_9EURY|nr:glycosyltransferase [Methanolobus mangrovi]WMW23245.1 glycosyltransferase [Methanolobus mangrovi]
MGKYDYIVVTPCKNEEESLPSLIDSVINNTIKPNLWVIVDDGSTDSTPLILENLKNKVEWVYVISEKESKRDLSFHYAQIVDSAIKYSIDFCDKNAISHEFIALIDADMVLDKDFFEKILGQFETDPDLGVCSGSAAYYLGDKLVHENGRSQNPIGGLRVWRKECFEESGGFPLSYSADSVSNVMAILSGWKIKKYNDIIAITSRPTNSTEGLWKGYKVRGISDYYRDYYPIYVLLKSLKYCIKYPFFYIGVAYLYGYIYGVLVVREKIDMPEVRCYYRNKYKEFFD